MKTKSIVFSDVDQVALEEREVEITSESGSTWIKTEKSILSAGTELACLSGSESWAPFPWVPGYGSVGVVIQAGDPDAGISEGDRIFTYGRHEGISMANTVLRKIPPTLPAEEAVFSRMAAVAITALRVSSCELGDTVAVFGLGLVGNFAAQLFTMAGCDVIGIDVSAHRRKIAGDCGIWRCLQPGDDLAGQINELTHGRRCQTVVDATGIPAVIAEEPACAGKLGELILLGSPRGRYSGDFTRFLNFSHLAGEGNITIKGAHEFRFPMAADPENRYKHSFESNVDAILERIADGRLKTRELISHMVSPSDAAAVYRDLREGKEDYMGVIFDWGAL
jgi:2-desacetyl-2-hydroxyethyl bacteriochlorophyllide A dehydrogenase